MSKQQLVELFFQNAETLTPFRILLILLCSLGVSVIIYLVYRFTTRTDGYSESFNQGNILLTLLTSIIMMLISTNIAVSLGMVGALSIVRFRTAVKNPRDTLFLFWSIVSGLCVGCQYFVLAILSLFFVSAVVIVLQILRARSRENHTLILCLDRSKNLSQEQILDVLANAECSSRTLAINYAENSCEMVFALTGTTSKCTAATEKLALLDGVITANLVGSETNY